MSWFIDRGRRLKRLEHILATWGYLALFGIADVQRESGEPYDAIRDYEHAARIAGEIESCYLKAKALSGMGEAVLRTRGVEAARIYWREAYDIFEQIGAYEAAEVHVRLQVFA